MQDSLLCWLKGPCPSDSISIAGKRERVRRSILFSIFILSFSIAATPQSKTTPSFSIYLTQLPESTIQNLERNHGDLETVPLEPTPLISEKDIVEYRFPSHVIKLTPEGFDKISKIKVHDVSQGIPFVVVLNGKKAYIGMFWCLFSSIFTPYPYILWPSLAVQQHGCSTCIQICPQIYFTPPSDVRDAAYMPLKTLKLLKKDSSQ
jgi:hypothetical protein